MHLRGPLWSQNIKDVGIFGPGGFAISAPDSWQKLAAYSSQVVSELERTMVKEIEEIYGPAPKWFQAETLVL
jgi:hypothetical protein